MNYQPIKGTHDIYGQEIEKSQYIEELFSAVAELYAYRKIETPILEYTALFQRGTGESSDVVRKEMYTFLDKGERSLTLRPEMTAGIIRSIISNKLYADDLPIKLYSIGPCFRYERPQLGRYRQFKQFSVENLGSDSARTDAETVILAMQCLYMLGFKDLELKINTIGDKESRDAYREALKGYFSSKIDSMCEDCHQRLELNPLRILDCKVPEDQEIAKGAPKIKDYLSDASQDRFALTLSIINDLGIEYEVDDSLVRGLDYYSEMVFEIHAKGENGEDFGAIGGGGHYGGLSKELGGPDLAGVGFAFGLERVLSLADSLHLLDHIKAELDCYMIPMSEKVLNDSFNIVSELRGNGISVDSPLGVQKVGSGLKKAERKGAKFALILGEDELEKGVIQLKDLNKKEQIEVPLEEISEQIEELLEEKEHEHHCCHGDGECHCHDHEKEEE